MGWCPWALKEGNGVAVPVYEKRGMMSSGALSLWSALLLSLTLPCEIVTSAKGYDRALGTHAGLDQENQFEMELNSCV